MLLESDTLRCQQSTGFTVSPACFGSVNAEMPSATSGLGPDFLHGAALQLQISRHPGPGYEAQSVRK